MPRHSFEQATFTRLTYCEHCNGLLWGLRYQGVRCKDCGYVCHTQCESAAPVCSGIGSAKSSSKDKYSSPAKESLRSLQRQINAAQSAASLVEDPADGLTLEKIQNIIVSAVVHAQDSTDPPSEYLANMPPLNPQISAKNFARFASRCGPMFAFRDAIILLLNWEKPMDTLVAMVAYCLICLHPKILLFIPQLVLLHIITSAYYKRYGQPSSHAQEEDASSKESSLESSSKAPVQRASKSSPTSRSSTAAAPASDVQPNSSQNASARRPFTFNLSSALFPTFDESSPEYLKNMQNLQNMMGEVSDIYDLVAANAHYFDWSSEADTMRVLQAVVFSMVVLLGLVWFIPLNIICLVTGVSVFLMNTRFAKYCIKEIMPYALKFGQTKMEYVARWYAKLERQLEEQERVRQVSLFENQRWWSGSGFAPQMLENERSPWSDLSGTIQLPPKEDMPAPKGYKWVQDDWKLDTTGPWINDVLNIEILVFPEEGGWVYSDNNWISYGKGTKDTNRQERLTRRRRWVRLCEKIQKPALENLHDM